MAAMANSAFGCMSKPFRRPTYGKNTGTNRAPKKKRVDRSNFDCARFTLSTVLRQIGSEPTTQVKVGQFLQSQDIVIKDLVHAIHDVWRY